MPGEVLICIYTDHVGPHVIQAVDSSGSCSRTDHVGPHVIQAVDRMQPYWACGAMCFARTCNNTQPTDHVGPCVLQGAIGPCVNVMAAGEGFGDLAVLHGKPRAGTVVVQVTLMSTWQQNVGPSTL
jgi:hypothetical protein